MLTGEIKNPFSPPGQDFLRQNLRVANDILKQANVLLLAPYLQSFVGSINIKIGEIDIGLDIEPESGAADSLVRKLFWFTHVIIPKFHCLFD